MSLYECPLSSSFPIFILKNNSGFCLISLETLMLLHHAFNLLVMLMLWKLTYTQLKHKCCNISLIESLARDLIILKWNKMFRFVFVSSELMYIPLDFVSSTSIKRSNCTWLNQTKNKFWYRDCVYNLINSFTSIIFNIKPQ